MTLQKLPRSKYTGMHHQGCYIGTVYTPEHMRAYAQKAVAAEREACARVCVNLEDADIFTLNKCADAIRARGQA